MPSLRSLLGAGLGIALILGHAIFTIDFFGGEQQQRKAEALRPGAVTEATRNAAPIIQAVKAYTARHSGRPPGELADLVPDYLARVPEPGVLARDGWHYRAGDGTRDGCSLLVCVGPEYCNPGSFGDAFVFHANGRYAREAYGGVLETMGKWAYYHE